MIKVLWTKVRSFFLPLQIPRISRSGLESSPVRNEKGFTLIELVIVIALVALTVGVTGDIIISLIRSFSKTRIITEIDRVGTNTISKLEKEIRVASEITTPSTLGTAGCTSTLEFTRRDSDVDITTISYVINTASGTFQRSETFNVTTISANSNLLGNNIVATGGEFCLVNQDPDVVVIRLTLQQNNSSGSPVFDGDVTFEQAVVARGTYNN